jgi:hypothetical protein
MIQICRFHAHDDIAGVPTGAGDGSRAYTCTRTTGHPQPGPYTWLHVPELSHGSLGGTLAEEYGLYAELPAALAAYRGRWVEYGVLEHAYAANHPDEFADLVARFGHTAIEASRYTVSSYLARTLGDLSRAGSVLFHPGEATGRWSYNSNISWWALTPEPLWSSRVSWADTGHSISYVPGQVEAKDLPSMRTTTQGLAEPLGSSVPGASPLVVHQRGQTHRATREQGRPWLGAAHGGRRPERSIEQAQGLSVEHHSTVTGGLC